MLNWFLLLLCHVNEINSLSKSKNAQAPNMRNSLITMHSLDSQTKVVQLKSYLTKIENTPSVWTEKEKFGFLGNAWLLDLTLRVSWTATSTV